MYGGYGGDAVLRSRFLSHDAFQASNDKKKSIDTSKSYCVGQVNDPASFFSTGNGAARGVFASEKRLPDDHQEIRSGSVCSFNYVQR